MREMISVSYYHVCQDKSYEKSNFYDVYICQYGGWKRCSNERVKQRNARTNPETSDPGQTHLSTLEPINVRQTVDMSERANVNCDNMPAPSGNFVDATDDSCAGDSGANETETDRRQRTDRSSKRERNSDNNVCMPNSESDCDDMCCENFKKLTSECLRIMIEMLAKASVHLNSDIKSTAKKKVELMMQNGVT